MAKSRIRQSQGALTGSSMATTGIVLSAVAMVLTLLLIIPAALLLPALSKAKERAQTINCVNHVKQLSLAVRMYASDNNDHFPSAANWCDAVQNYVGSPRPYQCAADSSLRCAFAYNQKLDGLKDDEINPQTVLFFESSTGWNAAGGPELFDAHKHSRTRIVVGYADGSVHQLPRSQLETLRWEP
jgi:competence protein ComGC